MDQTAAHGASFILQDRLLHCSDGTPTFVCSQCGLILACLPQGALKRDGVVCALCRVKCKRVILPYIFRYFCNELVMMKIALRLQLEGAGERL